MIRRMGRVVLSYKITKIQKVLQLKHQMKINAKIARYCL